MPLVSTTVTNMVLKPKYHVYYARIRIEGKIYQRSLEEKVFSRAKLVLPDKLKEIRDSVMRTVDVSRFAKAITFEEVARVYRQDFETDPRLRPKSKEKRHNAMASVRQTWPAVFGRQLRQISANDLEEFLRDFENGKARWTPPGAKAGVAGTSPTTITGIIKFFTEVFALGIKSGVIFGENPAAEMPRKRH